MTVPSVGGPEVVADRVRQLDALPAVLVGSGVNTTWPRRVEHDSRRRVRVGEGDAVEHERVAVGIAVVGQHVDVVGRAGAGRGDVGVGTGGRLSSPPSTDVTVTATARRRALRRDRR